MRVETYSLEEIDRVEDLYRGQHGQPSLGQALEMLLHRWAAGARDEATLIRLLFLLWYQNCEPPFLTGLPMEYAGPSFEEIFESGGGETGAPPLLLWTVAQMAQSFPSAISFEEEQSWEAAADRLFHRAKRLKPGLIAQDFVGLGAAGDYFRQVFQLK